MQKMLAYTVAPLCFFWAVVATVLYLFNPIPLLDEGHRAFGVPDERAAKALVELPGNFGLGERFTFDVGPTTQTLLDDGRTVIIQVRIRDCRQMPFP